MNTKIDFASPFPSGAGIWSNDPWELMIKHITKKLLQTILIFVDY